MELPRTRFFSVEANHVHLEDAGYRRLPRALKTRIGSAPDQPFLLGVEEDKPDCAPWRR
jgi:hypothetical protein